MSDRAIAARLSLAPETVRWYNKELYLKLGVTNRTQAVRRATALGVLDLPLAREHGDAPAVSRSHGPGATAPAAAAAVPHSAIQYVKHDGVHLAYQVMGAGPVDVLFVHGFISHLEVAWEEPEYRAFFEQLGRVARVIIYDKRGVGLSDRLHGAPTLEENVGDACAVLDAARSKRAFIMGTSEGGAASILLASQHPERVRGLILIGATARVARAGDAPAWARPVDEFNRGIQLIQDAWGTPWSVERFAPSRMRDERFVAWWARIFRAASSPSSIRAVMEVARDVDISELLPQVRARTLVLHRTDDLVVRADAGRYLAQRMPNARFVELPGADHVYFVNGEPVLRAAAEFMAEPDDAPAAESRLAIILHMGGSGALLTPDKRAIADAHRARHVRATPHGWTALFETPSRAIACARGLRALGRGRVGAIALHIGECREADGIPIGVAHEVTQQLADLAAPGEVIVSETLHDILAGSGVALERFVPRRAGDVGDAPFGWRLAD